MVQAQGGGRADTKMLGELFSARKSGVTDGARALHLLPRLKTVQERGYGALRFESAVVNRMGTCSEFGR